MLSKNKIKLIRSLELKKNRLSTGLFVAEGTKLVIDLLNSDVGISEIFSTYAVMPELMKYKCDCRIEQVSEEEMARISFLKSTPEILALCRIPRQVINWDEIQNGLTLVLDTIQDPGNLGTIVRLADWYGIKNIVCSEETADLYNPKVIQSTMGAFARVRVHYLALPAFLQKANQLNLPVYGTFLEGENLYSSDLTANGLIIMGNEGKGLSDDATACVTRKVSIPSYPPGVITSESLNVAIATAIVCSEFRRRVICKGERSSQQPARHQPPKT